jgi:putative oxidoreductase
MLKPDAKASANRSSLAPLMLRLTLAAVMFPHGAQKALGWFGGHGWDNTMKFFTEQIGLPAPLATTLILLEFVGPLLLVLGFATRLVALGFLALMVGAIVKVHAVNGFFMNWTNAQQGEGFEYHLLAIGIAIALALGGAGCCSLDAKLFRRD